MRERQEPKALRKQRPYSCEHTTVRVGNRQEDDANRSPPSNHEKEQKHMRANELTSKVRERKELKTMRRRYALVKYCSGTCKRAQKKRQMKFGIVICWQRLEPMAGEYPRFFFSLFVRCSTAIRAWFILG